ncbi:MAG TPA: P-II family nitrogen regulator [Methanocella sp.]|uniref:P-II family nitrogen regulator n=1 Tax=Methanocella sp. TaxID=2052833 RepID=UPI002C5F139B|nr:P-II family nitrogen regulator [Methanocella sp.]HTY90253.1 P-II family nitrogen regulator [Methanocella sp.]
MKKIEAIIRPTKLEEVKKALSAAKYNSISVTEINGRGKQKGTVQQIKEDGESRYTWYRREILPKVKVEIFVNDDEAQKVINTISTSAWTGDIGDGKIFILPVDNVIKIRTGEMDEKAL